MAISRTACYAHGTYVTKLFISHIVLLPFSVLIICGNILCPILPFPTHSLDFSRFSPTKYISLIAYFTKFVCFLSISIMKN